MNQTGTVYIIDDEIEVLHSLQWLIESVDLKVEVFTNCKDFIDNYQPTGPECLVLDVKMPNMSGTQLHDLLIDKSFDIPVVFITGHGDIPMAVEAMKKGALEFITKPISHDTLLKTINKALSKSQESIMQKRECAAINANIASLTNREQEVFELLTLGLSTKSIAGELGISPNTAELHRAKVMKKMQVHSVTEMVCMLAHHNLIKRTEDSTMMHD